MIGQMTSQEATSLPHPPATKGWRAGWRALLGLAILYAVIWVIRVIMGVGPNLLLRWLHAGPDVRAYLGSTLNYGVGIASYILLPAWALRKITAIDPRPVFFPKHKGWWQDLFFGFLLITIVLALFFLLEVKAGWLVIDGWTWRTLPMRDWLRVAWVGLLVNVGVAIGEETIFRGYLLTALKHSWGRWGALGAMTVIFGLFHLPAYSEAGMPSGTLTLAIALAALFGLLFGLAYLRTGSLWLPVALHFTWNFVENDVLNLTADAANPNLVGALTRLAGPLTATEIGWGNVVVIEALAFSLISLGAWLWLRSRR
jgi:membrane protease YdiL (CAAX protease family)